MLTMSPDAPEITRLLRTQAWGELARYFAERQPASAEEYSARALLTLQRSGGEGGGSIDWPAVIADMRQACVLKPGDLLLAVNLIQALLDSRQLQEAWGLAGRTCEQHPDAFPAWEKRALAAIATQRWAEAHEALLHAQGLIGNDRPLPERLAGLLSELSLRWWEPICMGGVVLRIPDVTDAEFLAATFRNGDFMVHYHRFQESGDEAVSAFIAHAKLAPRQSRRIDWIVQDSNGRRVGLAAIVDIDWGNARGELLVGLPGKAAPMVSLKASFAALEFAFTRLRLAKLVSYVYADNPTAQANTLHLGFEQEGLLRSHIASPTGRIDLFVNGMTAAGFAGNALFHRLERRWRAGI